MTAEVTSLTGEHANLASSGRAAQVGSGLVPGAVAFVTGLVAAVVSIGVGVPKEENSGQVLLTAPVLTEVRVIVGTAAMLAVAAVFAVALGAILRRSAAAITIAVGSHLDRIREQDRMPAPRRPHPPRAQRQPGLTQVALALAQARPRQQALLVLAYLRKGDTFAELAAGLGAPSQRH